MSNIKLFGQLLVPPLLSVLLLRLFFADWWDSVGMRPRWSVWILLSAGLLLLSHYAWTAYERWRQRKDTPPVPSAVPAAAPSAVSPLFLSREQERRVLAAAARALAGHCHRVELYRERGKLVIREVTAGP